MKYDPIAAITDFVFVQSELAKVDIIMIPGTAQTVLAERASELYLQ
jgi:hypothetical protein